MARKPEAPPAPVAPEKKPVPFIEWPGEPERLCGNCDHFEMPPPHLSPTSRGQCHNLISQTMFTRSVDKACRNGFYPDVQRFPLHVRLGIVPAKED